MPHPTEGHYLWRTLTIFKKARIMSNLIRPTPIDREITLPEDAFITSKTNLQGHITYCNKTFTHISGYSNNVLIGAPHHIVRHSDMPRGVFKLLWDTISAKQEFIGYVKNMCSDGSYYWVLATVTPDLDESRNLSGYYSVRRKAKKEAIEAIKPIYTAMLKAESEVTASRQPQAGIDALMNLIKDKGISNYETFVLGL